MLLYSMYFVYTKTYNTGVKSYKNISYKIFTIHSYYYIIKILPVLYEHIFIILIFCVTVIFILIIVFSVICKYIEIFPKESVKNSSAPDSVILR